MLGAQVGQQDRLFYKFNLEDVVPKDHLVRKLDAVLDLSWLRSELSPFYSHTGRPSIDPELMIRMLLVGYCYSIRSERRLCQEVELNLAYRWFCRLGLEDKVPDHSTFSVNRHGRFRQSDILRSVFENVVRRCMKAGLVSGEGFAVDASVIEANASRFARIEGADIDWTDELQAQRPVKEYIEALNGGNAPTNPKRKPKAMSPTDPSAAWTIRGRNKIMFGYSLNYLIDMENAVILDVEATPTRITKEVEATENMLERTENRFDLKPNHIAGDMAYGTGKMLGWLEKKKIEPHIPVKDMAKRDDGTLSRDDFSFDMGRDLYTCPQGKVLKTTGKVHDGKTLLYRASKRDCDLCPLKTKCCPRTPSRKIPRDINEAARDHARSLNGTEAYNQSACNRKKIERLFGEAKQNLAMTRLRLRGLSGAKDEFLLTATVQNLKRLAKFISRPPPT
ncbi:IS1182 family transposase, partial [Candidatus Terasakiella magnetica]|uniref:IS1182 family transposase n=1 Tax=Candidatus Terasakiella magnetica TaxID=1867952 RepID=UPI000840D08E